MRKLSNPQAGQIFLYLSRQAESSSCLQVFRKVLKVRKIPAKTSVVISITNNCHTHCY